MKEFRVQINSQVFVESGEGFTEARDKALTSHRISDDLLSAVVSVRTMGNVIEKPTLLAVETFRRIRRGGRWRVDRRI